MPDKETADNYYFDLLKAEYKNPNTLKSYTNRLETIIAKLKAPVDTILKNPTEYYPKIKENYDSITTRKNMLTVLLALLRIDESLANTEAAKEWRQKHDELTRFQIAKVKRSEPADKQIEKYTSFEEIEEKYEDLAKHSPHKTQKESMEYLLVSIILYLRPKRADYGSIQIYNDTDPRKTDQNYIVLRKKGTSYLVMNLYKTSTYYQTVEEDLPQALKRDIQASLSRWPRDYLFAKINGEPMSNNTYSVYVKKTFERLFGRATGVSLLRHIYISEKLDFDDMTLEEKDQEAKLMLHTRGLQDAYKWPKKTLCPKLCAAYIPSVRVTRKMKRSKPSSLSVKEQNQKNPKNPKETPEEG